MIDCYILKYIFKFIFIAKLFAVDIIFYFRIIRIIKIINQIHQKNKNQKKTLC